MLNFTKRLFLAATASACLLSPALAQEAITFGFLMPTKTVLGKQAVQAAEVAADMLNAQGGVLGKQVKLAVYDDNYSPAEGASVAQRAIEQDGARFLGGNFSSSVGLAIIPIVQAEGALYVASMPKSTLITESGYANVFQMNSTTKEDGAALVKLFSELKPQKVAYLGENSDFSRELGASVKALTEAAGGQMVYTDFWDLKQTDFNAQVTLAKASGADTFVVMAGVAETIAGVVRSARDLGFEPKNLVVGPGALNTNVIKLLGGQAEGIISVDIYLPDTDNPMNKQFIEAYRAKWGMVPEKTEVLAFETIWLLGQAINTAGTDDVEAVAAALREGEWETPRGTIRFSPENRIVTEGYVVTVKDGQIVGK